MGKGTPAKHQVNGEGIQQKTNNKHWSQDVKLNLFSFLRCHLSLKKHVNKFKLNITTYFGRKLSPTWRQLQGTFQSFSEFLKLAFKLSKEKARERVQTRKDIQVTAVPSGIIGVLNAFLSTHRCLHTLPRAPVSKEAGREMQVTLPPDQSMDNCSCPFLVPCSHTQKVCYTSATQTPQPT